MSISSSRPMPSVPLTRWTLMWSRLIIVRLGSQWESCGVSGIPPSANRALEMFSSRIWTSPLTTKVVILAENFNFKISVLYDTFSSFGNILSCKVVDEGQGGKQRGNISLWVQWGWIFFQSHCIFFYLEYSHFSDGSTSKGYGFVHFETEESATRAIEKV